MFAQIRASLAPPSFATADQNRVARLLSVIQLSAAALLFIFLIGRLVTGTYTLLDANLYILGGLALLLLLLWFGMRLGYLRVAAYGTVGFAWAALAYVSWSSGGVRDSGYIAFFVITMITSLVLGWREALVFLVLAIAAGWGLAFAEVQGLILGEEVSAYEIMSELTVVYLLFAVLLYLLVSNLSNALEESRQTNAELQAFSVELEKRVAERSQELLLAADVARRISSLSDLGTLLHEAVTQIQDTFQLYYAQVYLLDDKGQYLELRAGTGGVGQLLLEQKHRLPVDGKSVNSTAFVTGQPVIVADTEASDIFQPNPLLPLTRAEMSVPLLLGVTAVGVLNLQSSTPESLTSASLPAFQALAGQLVTAITNANLFAERERVAASLREERKQAQSILESISVPMVISLASNGTAAYVNEPLADVVQVPHDKLIGRTTPNFYASPAERQKFFHELKENGRVVNYELRLKRGNGEPFWALTSGHLITFQNQPAVLTTFIDVDERHKAEETVAQRAAQLEAVAQVSAIATSILDTTKLLQEVVDLTKSRFNLYHAHIYLVDDVGGFLNLAAGAGEVGRKMVSAGLRIPLGQEKSLVARAARSVRGVTVNDVQADPSFLPNPLLPLTRAEMAVPLQISGHTLGVLDVQAEESGRFTDEDMSIFTTLAAQVAGALRNAQQYEETRTALAETESLLDVTRIAGSSLDTEGILAQVLEKVLAVTQFEAGLISRVNPATATLKLASHRLPKQFLEKLQQNGLPGTLCDLVFRRQEAVTLFNLTEDAPVNVTGAVKMGYLSYQGVPIQARGETLGVISIFSSRILAKDKAHTDLLMAVGQQIGFALQNAMLFEQMQHVLAETETFRRLIENSNQGVAIATLDGAIAYANPALLQFLEIDDLSNLQGESLTNFYPGDLRVFAETEIIFSVLDGERWQGEMKLISTSGREIPTLENYTLVRDEAGEPSELALIITDITERKEAEKAQQRLAAELEERLQEVDSLQRAMTHEGWQAFFAAQERPLLGYHFQDGDLRLIPTTPAENGATQDLLLGVRPFDGEISAADNATTITPLKVRGEPIGLLGVRHPEGEALDLETQALLEAISAQVAEALDRARLYEETELGRQQQSQRARREQLLREITAKVRSSADVDTVLRTAVQEIGRTLGRKAFIQLELPHEADEPELHTS